MDTTTKDFAVMEPNVRDLTLELPAIIKEADHSEMWGIDLKVESIPRSIVVVKFLKANAGDVKLAHVQLVKALAWRKTVKPAELLESKKFNIQKFGGLGYVGSSSCDFELCLHVQVSVYRYDGKTDVITWNVYGGTKDIKHTFENVDE